MKKSLFKPAWWLKSCHFQTMWQSVFRRTRLRTKRERLVLEDGDFIDLDWAGYHDDSPLVLILHGLGGSSRSPYVKGLMQKLVAMKWGAIGMHFRGCSGEPNLLPRMYHIGETQDVNLVVKRLRQRYPHRPLCAVGYSMGGAVLLKWLGEEGDRVPLDAAVAVSVPFEVANIAKTFNKGFARFYQWWFISQLREDVISKSKRMSLPVDPSNITDFSTFEEFDHKITAPLNGFTSTEEYYSQGNCWEYVNQIVVPTLIIHSTDDPLVESVPLHENKAMPTNVTLEVSEYGGHVGFVSGGTPWNPEYWLDTRIPAFLAARCVRNDNAAG